jgi:hypothetical protein
MRSLTEELIQKYEPISSASIKQAFEKRLSEIGIENIFIDDVVVDYEGDITVSFADDEHNQLDILFAYDDDEGPVAIILDDEDADEFIVINLDSLAPSLKQTAFGVYVNLTDLDWLSGSVLSTMLQSVEHLEDAEEAPKRPQVVADKYGYIKNESFDLYGISEESDTDIEIDEARKISVIRGGKRVRLAVVKKVRRKILTGKQKTAIRKAVRKRKVQQAKINRKRKRSLKVRKRINVKTPKLTRFQKAAGTANRRV